VALGTIVVLLVGLLFVPLYRNSFALPRTAVAVVNGTAIRQGEFAPRVQYARHSRLQSFVQILQAGATGLDASAFSSLLGRDQIPDNVRSQMIDEVLIRQEATQRGITVTEVDIDDELERQVMSSLGLDTPVPGTGTPPTPRPTPTGLAQSVKNAIEGNVEMARVRADMGERAYRRLVANDVWRRKLNEALATEIESEVEQVQVEYLLFDSREVAQAAAEAIKAGLSWSQVVSQFGPTPTPTPEPSPTATPAGLPTPTPSSTPRATPTGGPTPSPTVTPEPHARAVGGPTWVTREGLDLDFGIQSDTDRAAVLALAKGAVSDPLEGSTQTDGSGVLLLHVLDKAEQRPRTAEELQSLKDGAVDDWLARVKKEAKIEQPPLDASWVPPEPDWFVQAVNEMMTKLAQPTIGPQPLPITVAPVSTSAQPTP
jgi:hypothetical protein